MPQKLTETRETYLNLQMRLCSKCGKSLEPSGQRCPVCFHEPETIEGYLAFAPELAYQSEGFEADYFGRLSQMEAGNFWFRSRNRLITWALRRYFPGAENLLEIGCGTGFVLSGIRNARPELNLSGSEIFSAGLNFAAQRLPGVELFQMDARRIPFRDEFDVIGAFDVIEHIEEDDQVLSQMHRATRKQGGILLTVPHHPFLWSQSDDYARHVRRYKAQELRRKVARAGFKVVRLSSFVSLLMPLLVASRFKRRIVDAEFDPMDEFDIGSFWNASLEKILDAERTFIRAGLSFPFGGSMLLIARRS
jgi:SAM-dependent methyltransferase